MIRVLPEGRDRFACWWLRLCDVRAGWIRINLTIVDQLNIAVSAEETK